MKKKFYLSKTFWVATLGYAAQFVPAVDEFTKANPMVFETLWTFAVLVARTFKSDIKFLD